MPKPKRIVTDEPPPNQYFAAPSACTFFSSGCVLLDRVLSGGYVLGRIANIVGDRSTGKTLLAIEACANFIRSFPNGQIRYNEVEAAFDLPYAQALGLPVETVQFVEGCFTVEELFKDMDKFLDTIPNDHPGLYILDSLDALSDAAEKEREFGEGTFGTAKAKLMGQLFRLLVQKLEKKRVAVIIISQERDAVGVTFGKKSTRSGGRALDFYASQILWLAQKGTMKKTREGVERTIGIQIVAKCEKNKIGLPFRSCEFPIIFGYGIDDIVASLEWLKLVKMGEKVGLTDDQIDKLVKNLDKKTPEELEQIRQDCTAAVIEGWQEVEARFLPNRRKYSGG